MDPIKWLPNQARRYVHKDKPTKNRDGNTASRIEYQCHPSAKRKHSHNEALASRLDHETGASIQMLGGREPSLSKKKNELFRMAVNKILVYRQPFFFFFFFESEPPLSQVRYKLAFVLDLVLAIALEMKCIGRFFLSPTKKQHKRQAMPERIVRTKTITTQFRGCSGET